MRRRKLYFKVKEWKRFDIEKQEHLTKKYHVILTDHRTRKEKFDAFLKSFNSKNLDSGIKKFNKGVTKFNRTLDAFDMKIFPEDNKKRYKALTG